MRERIMQRTIPIEEVCYASQSPLMQVYDSTLNALFCKDQHAQAMHAASRDTHSESTAKAFDLSCMQIKSDSVLCEPPMGSKALQDACSRIGLPGSCGKLAGLEGGMGAGCRCGRRCSTARSACSCCAPLHALWRRMSASCRMSCARQAPFDT